TTTRSPRGFTFMEKLLVYTFRLGQQHYGVVMWQAILVPGSPPAITSCDIAICYQCPINAVPSKSASLRWRAGRSAVLAGRLKGSPILVTGSYNSLLQRAPLSRASGSRPNQHEGKVGPSLSLVPRQRAPSRL